MLKTKASKRSIFILLIFIICIVMPVVFCYIVPAVQNGVATDAQTTAASAANSTENRNGSKITVSCNGAITLGYYSVIITAGESSAGKAKVYYRTLNGSAIAGTHYTQVSGVQEISPNAKFTIKVYPSTVNVGEAELTLGSSTYTNQNNPATIKKDFLFEVYRVDNGYIETNNAGEKINNKVVLYAANLNLKLNYTYLGNKGTQNIHNGLANGYLTDTLKNSTAVVYYSDGNVVEAGTGQTQKNTTKDSLPIKRSQLFNDNIYNYFIGTGAKLVFDVRGKITKENKVLDGTGPGIRNSIYGGSMYDEYKIGDITAPYPSIAKSKLANDPDTVYKALYEFSKGTLNSMYNSENLGSKYMFDKDEDGNTHYYLDWNHNVPAGFNNSYVYQKAEFLDNNGWSRLSDQTLYAKFMDNAEPEVKGYYVTNTGYRLGDTVEIAVKFNEIVVETKGDQGENQRSYLSVTLGTSLRNFYYDRGSGTDTLVYNYTLGSDSRDANLQLNELNINSLNRFINICDLAYNRISGGTAHNNISSGSYSPFSACKYRPEALRSLNASSVQLACNIDTQIPEIVATPDAATPTDRSITSVLYNITVKNKSNGTVLQYLFSREPVLAAGVKLNNLDFEGNSNRAKLSQSGLNGKYYLHLYAVNAMGMCDYWTSEPLYFDNQAPQIELNFITSGYKPEHKFSFALSDLPGYSGDEAIYNSKIAKAYVFFTEETKATPDNDSEGILIINGGQRVAQDKINPDYVYTEDSQNGYFGITANQDTKINGVKIFDDTIKTMYLHLRVYDDLGNASTEVYATPFLMNTETKIGEGFEYFFRQNDIRTAHYSGTDGIAFTNTYFAVENSELVFVYDSAQKISVTSFKINGNAQNIAYKNEDTDYTEDDGSTGTRKHSILEINPDNGNMPPYGYYEIVFEVAGVSGGQKQTARFYVSAETADKSHDTNVLTRNILNMNEQKLIKSKYWVTARDFIYRKSNKTDKTDSSYYEGTGFSKAEGMIEAVTFVGTGKPLVYASYNAALSDMINRERKDIRLVTAAEKTTSFIQSLNQSVVKNPEGKVFTTTDNIFEYKPKNFTGTEEYHYYSSNDSYAIVDALTANAKKTLGSNPNSSEYNQYRMHNTAGIGFDLNQIVEVAGYQIFDNTVYIDGYGTIPIASNIVMKNYTESSSGDTIPTEVYYSVSGAGVYKRLYIPKEGIVLNSKNALPSTGVYDIIEFSDLGCSFKTVYVDCSSPQLLVQLYKGGANTAVEKDYFDYSDNNQAFEVSKIYLKQISDSDPNSILAIYEADSMGGQTLVGIYTADELGTMEDIILNSTKEYLLYIYDRSGNKVLINIYIKTTGIQIEKSMLTSSDSYTVTITNRRANEIVSSDIYFNDVLIPGLTFSNNKFNTVITLTDSGSYYLRITDIYGYVFEERFEYSKTPPQGDLYERNDAGGWTALKNTSALTYDHATNTYTVSSRRDIQFRYTNANYRVTLYNVNNYENKVIDAVIGVSPKTYVIEIPASNTNWSIRLGYTNDAYIYTMFTSIVDTEPPFIYGVVNLGAGTSGGAVLDRVLSGTITNKKSVSIFWEDAETSVVKIEVSIDGGTHTAFSDLAAYETDGFVITNEGSYVFRCYDVLGNMSEFHITLDRSLNFVMQTNGKTINEPGAGTIYSGKDMYFYIEEQLFFQTDTVLISANKNMVSYTVNYGENESDPNDYDKQSFLFSFTAEEKLNPGITYVERLLYEIGGKKVYYGMHKDGRVYIKFVAPAALANSNWDAVLQKTDTYTIGIYDTLGYYSIDGTGCEMSSENAVEVSFSLSNKKSTLTFLDFNGAALADVRSEETGRFNTDFKFNASALASSDITKIEFRYHPLELSLAQYINIYPAGDIRMVFDSDGLYEFIFTNIYGNTFTQLIKMGKGLSAVTTAIYNDGTQRTIELYDFSSVSNQSLIYAYSNKSLKFEFTGSYSSLTVLKNNTDITSFITVNYDPLYQLPYFMITGAGQYIITAVDDLGNSLTIEAEILLLDQNSTGIDIKEFLNNWNTDALKYDHNYVNRQLGFNQITDEVYYLSFDYFTFADYKFNLSKTAAYAGFTVLELFQQSGLAGVLKLPVNSDVLLNRYIYDSFDITQNYRLGINNGVYIVRAFDRYGNYTELTVQINNQADITFSKKMRDDANFSAVSTDLVSQIGLHSNYSIQIQTGGLYNYVLTVDNETFRGNQAITVTKTSNELTLVKYTVTYIDDFGNTLAFIASIDKKQPVLSVVDPSIFILHNNRLLTRQSTAVICDKTNITITYTINAGPSLAYRVGDSVELSGNYVFTVTDYAGNTSILTFTIDKEVEYTVYATAFSQSFVLPQGVLINSGTVSFYGRGNDESVNVKKVMRDGIEIDVPANQTFSENGNYVVTLIDTAGNEAVYSFVIVKTAVSSFYYTVPDGYTFFGVERLENGVYINARYLIERDNSGKEFIAVSENITLRITVANANLAMTADRFTFDITTDTTNPYLTIVNAVNGEKTKKDVTFIDISEDSTVYIYKDGVLVYQKAVKAGAVVDYTVSERGKYTVILFDEALNSVTYEFEREYTMNTFAIIIMVVVVLLLAVGIVVFIRMRKNIKVK